MPTLEERVAALEAAVTRFTGALTDTVETLKSLVGTLSPLADSFRALTEAEHETTRAVRELTGVVGSLVGTVRTLAEAQTRTEQELRTLIGRVDELTARVDGLAADVAALAGRLDRMEFKQEGERYEAETVRRAARILGPGEGGSPDELEVRRRLGQLLASVQVDREADPALADIIWWPEGQPGTIVIVEASPTIDAVDVVRARRRAETLEAAGAGKLRAYPVVVGQSLPDGARRLAAELGVEYYVEGEGPSEGLSRLRAGT